jgi:hypothetical protein
MMDSVYRHLHKSLATPFQWSESDCYVDVANYLFERTGYDCATRFRGKYHDALSCQKISGFLTNPIKPLEDCLSEFPLKITTKPERGDIGIVTIMHAGKPSPIGGVFLGKNWAMKLFNGLSIGEVSGVLKVWGAPDEK